MGLWLNMLLSEDIDGAEYVWEVCNNLAYFNEHLSPLSQHWLGERPQPRHVPQGQNLDVPERPVKSSKYSPRKPWSPPPPSPPPPPPPKKIPPTAPYWTNPSYAVEHARYIMPAPRSSVNIISDDTRYLFLLHEAHSIRGWTRRDYLICQCKLI